MKRGRVSFMHAVEWRLSRPLFSRSLVSIQTTTVRDNRKAGFYKITAFYGCRSRFVFSFAHLFGGQEEKVRKGSATDKGNVG